MQKIINNKIVQFYQCLECEKFVKKLKDNLCQQCFFNETKDLLNLPQARHTNNFRKPQYQKINYDIADI